MGESFHNYVPTTSSEAAGSISSRRDSKLTLVASCSKPFSYTSLKQTPLFKNVNIRKLPMNNVAVFLLKVGALETVRRLSKHRCPFIWSSLQTLQVFCYPPLKWLQRWDLFKNLIKGMQMLSRPLLVLSIATTFSDQSEQNNLDSDDIENSDGSDYHGVPESHSELPPTQSTIDVRVDGEALSQQSSANSLLDLYTKLDNEGVYLPERWFVTINTFGLFSYSSRKLPKSFGLFVYYSTSSRCQSYCRDFHSTSQNVRRNTLEFGRTFVVMPKGTHQATIVWLHGIEEKGSSWTQILETLPLPNIKWICPSAPTRQVTLFGGYPCTAWFNMESMSEDACDDLEGLDVTPGFSPY